MQVEHKTLMGTVLFVTVPDDSKNYWLETWISMDVLIIDTPDQEFYEELNGFYWQIIGLTSDITEDQARIMGFDSISELKEVMHQLNIYEVNPFTHPSKLSPICYNKNKAKWKKVQERTGKRIVLFKK